MCLQTIPLSLLLNIWGKPHFLKTSVVAVAVSALFAVWLPQVTAKKTTQTATADTGNGQTTIFLKRCRKAIVCP
jgi:hypothetical protein